MRLVLMFVLLALEVRTNEVPESIADKRVEVLHVDDRDELVFEVCLTVCEHHRRGNVFLNMANRTTGEKN